MIIKRVVVGPFASNCYIVGSEATGDGMIIDPGADAGEILSNAKELNIKITVLTHAHVDHIGAVREVKEATGAELAVHSADAQLLQMRQMDTIFGLPQSLPAPERLLQGGDTINVGGLRFLVLHTPGHTAGGICLFGEGVVFSGDTLFNYGIGRTDFPGGSHMQLIDGIHTKLMILPDSTVVYPGHGPETTIGAERHGNPFLRGG
ncbi:MBL fold metallo-hydrolase [Chloroflexota bacterium]